MNEAQKKYEQELEKLRAMRSDFSDGSRERFYAQYQATRHAYLTLCYEDHKEKGVWR
jgi:hypothetical protein